MFSDENLDGLAETITNLRKATATLPQTAKDVAQLVARTARDRRRDPRCRRIVARDDRRMRGPKFADALDATWRRSPTISRRLPQRIDRFTQKSEMQLGHFTEQGLFELERLVRETRSAAREFRDLSRSLKENPSQILYEPPESGVEIEP